MAFRLLVTATLASSTMLLSHTFAVRAEEQAWQADIDQIQTPQSNSTSSTADCPDACIEIYDPICGSDGVTYSNDCFLRIAQCENPASNIVKQGDGECAKATTPTPSNPSVDTPITSSGGSASSSSPVDTSDCPDICPMIYSPVCGSDGQTYSNTCTLSIASCNNPERNIVQVSEGECLSKSSSGSSTPSDETPESTQETSSCSQVCNKRYTPVCGSDGKTYSNQCMLNYASCKNPELNIVQVGDGECQTSSTSTNLSGSSSSLSSTSKSTQNTSNCPQICTMQYDPVCGSDGKTYSNACMLSVKSCNNPSLNLTQISSGECGGTIEETNTSTMSVNNSPDQSV